MNFTAIAVATMLGCAMAYEHVETPLSMLRSSTRSLTKTTKKKSCVGAAMLENCYLVNLFDKSETKLDAGRATVYTTTAKYSVYCTTTTSNKKIDYVKFVSGVATAAATNNVHTEYRAPFYWGGDYNGWIHPVDYLSQPCGAMKQLEVQGFVWGRSAEEPCFRQSYQLEARCPGMMTPPTPLPPPPRSSPTASPTNEPTDNAAPVGITSGTPSATPSQGPTPVPSSVPTAMASPNPSAAPTDMPSQRPSGGAPTFIPSPTPAPSTAMPSQSPSGGSSPTLTPYPSPAPSILPSEMPSLQPTGGPTRFPSVEPSAGPSPFPSVESPHASERPTATAVPTTYHSDLFAGPSPSPSFGPSLVPSSQPSDAPSAIPSLSPTVVPSSEGPSLQPSDGPTPLPTKTAVPSSESPSLQPSGEPTFFPTPTPSAVPTKPHQDGSSIYEIGVAYAVPGLTKLSATEFDSLRLITGNYLFHLLLDYLETDRTCNVMIQTLDADAIIESGFDLNTPDSRFNLYVKYNVYTFWNSDVDCTNYPPLEAAMQTGSPGVYDTLVSTVLPNLREVHWFGLEFSDDDYYF